MATPVAMPAIRDIAMALPGRALAARLYRPVEDETARLPVLIYFHGGGWVLGDLNSHDGVCRRLAHESGCAVVSVDYRLAPEHPFPAAFDDAIAAAGWVAAHADALGVDADRLALGGDSAGGNLAAAACLALRDAGGPKVSYQLLIYPATDFAMDTASHRDFGEGFLLDAGFQHWCHRHYLGDSGSRSDWRVSPLRAQSVAGLPPAFVLTASHDPLRDEGEAYAQRLVEAGCCVTLWRASGQIHAFLPMDGVMTAVPAVARRLGAHLALGLAAAAPAD